MIAMNIILDGDGAHPDLREKMAKGDVIHLGNGSPPISVSVLDAGMQSGLPSVMLRIDLPDGKTVMAETSARLFVTAARAISARYPRLLD